MKYTSTKSTTFFVQERISSKDQDNGLVCLNWIRPNDNEYLTEDGAMRQAAKVAKTTDNPLRVTQIVRTTTPFKAIN